jgi:hypothetical protein
MTAVRLNPLINFFATRDELASWVGEWARRYSLSCALTRHPPTVITLDVPWEDSEAAARLLRRHTHVFLRRVPIEARVDNVNHLWDLNPDMLSISLPPQTSTGLGIGLFGTGTRDRDSLRVWRAVGREFLARTTGGMWGVFPTCEPQFVAEYRYSPGAEALWRAGLRLRGFGADTWHPEKPPGGPSPD